MNLKERGFAVDTKLKDLRDYVQTIADEYGTRIAYKFFVDSEVESRTYNRLREDVFSLASYLVGAGYKRAHIAVLGGTSYEWVVSFLAIIISNNIVVPVDKLLPEKEQLEVLRMGDASVLFYDNEFKQSANTALETNPLIQQVIGFREAVFRDALKHPIDKLPATNIEELAEILFTSGTTGTSKGVMLSQKNILVNIEDIKRMDFTCGLKSDPVVMSVLPIHHTFELTVDNLGVLYCGATICINDSLANIVENLNRFKPGVILIVPAIAEVFYKKIKEGLEAQNQSKLKFARTMNHTLRKLHINADRKIYKDVLAKFGSNLTNVVVGGAALRPEICDLFAEFGVNIFQGYGLTECAPLVAANYPGVNKVGTVGKTVSYMETKIVNGEIMVKGPGVMMGYYKNPEATKEAIEDGWFHTGDLGFIDKEGFITITGRSKNLIILDNGKNIYPEELEEKIACIEGIKEVMVYADKGRICSLIVPENFQDKEKKKEIEREIKKLNEELPPYKKILSINYTSKEFPKTTTLKIKRREVMERIRIQTSKQENTYVAPKNEKQKEIQQAFERAIASGKIGIRDNFFEAGGDSLSALEASTILGIPAQLIYEYPSIEELETALMEEGIGRDGESRTDVNQIIITNNNLTYPVESDYTLLTGATGFLGAHILRELLIREVKVVCLVRNEERLKATLKRYFPNEFKNFSYKVIRGDIEQPHFGLNDKEYQILARKVKMVIHTAANVHHAGHYAEFERTNVFGTQNVMNFCLDSGAVLQHTSTASVSGSGTVNQRNPECTFDEFILDIGQQYEQNVYIHSKYKAEEQVLIARQKGLKANIYRIGTLTWRKSDGMFQKNVGENGFLGRCKGLFKVRMYSPELAEYPLDFTAVDECADAYVRLALYNKVNNIYNLYNPHLFTIENLKTKLLFQCKKVSKKTFDAALKKQSADKEIALLSFYSSIASTSKNVPISNEFTTKVLEELGFRWSKIGVKYLKYLKQFI